jgi:hypothetical protein
MAELAGEDQIVLAQVPFASEEETLQLADVIAVGWADVAPAQAGSKSGSMAAGGKFVGLAAE